MSSASTLIKSSEFPTITEKLEALRDGIMKPDGYEINTHPSQGHCQENLLKPYQLDYCIELSKSIDFRNMKVLEVGGSLPEKFVTDILEVQSWVAIQDPDYWKITNHDIHVKDARCSFDRITKSNLPPYTIILERAENIPGTLSNCFNLVFSISAFHSITAIPLILENIYNSLMPQGIAAISAGPIWSGPNGHFTPRVYDKIGRCYSFKEGDLEALIKWEHLLRSPDEIFFNLAKRTDITTASTIVNEIFFTNRLNRFFTDDYIRMFKNSSFGRKGTVSHNIQFQKLHEPLQTILEQKWPGRKNFTTQGFKATLQK
jgi:hypothetical protein